MVGWLAWLAKSIYELIDKVTFSWISYAVTYIYLTAIQHKRKKRFAEYDYFADGQPEKNGFFIPAIEWELERPQEQPALDKNADDVFVFGTNSKTDGLAIHISRRNNGKVSCSMLLRFSDGREFVLPKKHIIQMETTEEYTFGSSRLKLQCLLPMRKWRLFFNGLLRENSSHSEAGDSTFKHVSFTLIFTASSDVFDFKNEMHKRLLAHHTLASARKFSSLPLHALKQIQDIFNNYEQSGMIMGTIKVDGEDEQEIYLWGNRGRYRGELRSLKKGDIVQIYGSFQNGAVIHIGILNVDNILFKFSYGYVMRSDGFMHPIENLARGTDEIYQDQYSFHFFCGGVQYKLVIAEGDCESEFQKEFIGKSCAKFSNFILNGWQGRGFIFRGTISEGKKLIQPCMLKSGCKKEWPLVVPFSDTFCQDPSLTGGKGSSLGKLYQLSQQLDKKDHISPSLMFKVSNGFVVTTEAYKLFIKGALNEEIEVFQKEVWSSPEDKCKSLCEKMVTKVVGSKLPTEVEECVRVNMKRVFLSDYNTKKFAVRSSATGEDTEQMSAAGQMETYLGLKSTEDILKAVKKCWASQFTFQAVKYKRGYGQLLNSPMAVVVQEMVPCDVAGVSFTSDPLTGNPEFILITANYGLGESVVSASAEPDTIVLKRDIENNLVIHSQEIGTKSSKVIMSGDMGVQHIDADMDVSVCCLSDEMILKLGHLAVELEEKFGSPRDLEWGILGKEVYFFQARPITSIDTETDFESKRVFDSYMRIENEYFSKANVGEVLPGAGSLLGLTFLSKILDVCYVRQKWILWAGPELPKPPYFEKRICLAYRHYFFNILDAFLHLEEDVDDRTKGLMYAIYGRDITNDEMANLAKERHKAFGKKEENQLIYDIYTTQMMYTSGYYSSRISPKVNNFEYHVSSKDSPLKILREIGNNYQICIESMFCHFLCSFSSSLWNMKILTLLSEAKGEWDNEVYSDFGYLLSTCSEVESADVPAAVQQLGFVISKSIDAETFRKMDPNEALNWLETTDSEARIMFKDFLQKHGHRCLKEFDVRATPWGSNPIGFVKMLQKCVSANAQDCTEKDIPSFSTIFSNLHIPLTTLQKMKMYWFLLNGRRGVRERECSKSIVIKSMDKTRKAFNYLAEVMVKEGYLPNKDLLFFLVIDEIKQLIETRSPRLVSKAIKRSKFHEELDQLIFPEITTGVPRPVNLEKPPDITTEGFTMTGIPVSRGVVKATARVVTHLDEAFAIKQGDVLIAYSTDIGWTPYFPLLSGVVTELGGLISHGAVVAREYGLPCVVGLHGATQVFKSGDLVVLDGNKGTLKRIETNQNCE